MRKLCLATILTVLCSMCSYTFAAPTSTLAGYWKLDDKTQSTQAIDQTQTSHGIVWGGVKFEKGIAKFDGKDQYIEIPHQDAFLLDSGTVSLWFNAEKTSKKQGLWSKDSSGYDTGGHLTIWIQKDKVYARLQSDKKSYTLKSKKKIKKKKWYHVSVVYGVGGFELYVNGKLEKTNSYNGGLGETSGGQGNFEPIVLGANSWGSGNKVATPVRDYFKGQLDDVGFIAERFTESTIKQIADQTGPGSKLSLADFVTPSEFYVRRGGSDSNDGASPETAFRTIQHAVSKAAGAGTVIYVGPGEYREQIYIGKLNGQTAGSGTDSNPIRIIADTKGEITLESPGEVILDGRSKESFGFEISDRENWVIDGFTIRGQKNYGIQVTNGGVSVINCEISVPSKYGIYALAKGDIMVANNIFDRSPSSGHVIMVTPSNKKKPTSITITGNDLSMKGSLYLSSEFAKGFWSSRKTSRRNRYTYGIVVLGWKGPRVSRIEISNNQVSDTYLGIYAGVQSATPVEQIIANNTVTGSLYSIYSVARKAKSVTVVNNIVDTSYLGLISYSNKSKSVLIDSTMEHNITYNMAAFRRSFENDIIRGNPMFVDAPGGDFSLSSGSLGIDAGVDQNAPAVDIAGRSRPTDGDNDGIAQIDIGANELVNAKTRVRVVRWIETGTDQ